MLAYDLIKSLTRHSMRRLMTRQINREPWLISNHTDDRDKDF